MKIVSHKQGTKEWREWRGRGLGASDAPAVMGESPWTSPFELWLDKTGLMSRSPVNEFQVAAMKRGNELEPIARKMYEDSVGRNYPSLSATMDDFEYLRASFDGYNEDTNTIIEIKCPNKLDHAKAEKGKIPTKYIAQIQQQLLISNAAECKYVSYNGKDLAVVTISPDKQYQAKLQEAMIDMWARVVNLIPPDVTTKDVHKIIKQMNKDLENVKKAGIVLDLLTKPNKELENVR